MLHFPQKQSIRLDSELEQDCIKIDARNFMAKLRCMKPYRGFLILPGPGTFHWLIYTSLHPHSPQGSSPCSCGRRMLPLCHSQLRRIGYSSELLQYRCFSSQKSYFENSFYSHDILHWLFLHTQPASISPWHLLPTFLQSAYVVQLLSFGLYADGRVADGRVPTPTKNITFRLKATA